ncbi:DNA polymerase delta small subunit isoform X2 [Syzygium oleosum]|uniref:DNA polymerase delta small subunit isoform X2 n=1 Tax=Syzygium oleosum TaxID=219896 RepID=UPI0024B9BA32|nr:DNA polymerase delta small subunit isoform X2 [Syzygium oleosum]
MEIDAAASALRRKQSAYLSLDETFEIQKEMYRGQQYSQIYFARLHMMRTLLYSLVPNWKPHVPVCTVLGLEGGKECIIVGTLYKHMKLKPTILDEYSKERSAVPLVRRHNFMDPLDHLVLEDESGRVKLGGSSLSPTSYVTGVVAALHGRETDAGDFLVQDVLEAGLPSQLEFPLKSREDKYVVLVSGLSIGSSTCNPLQFQLLVDHITGHLGDEQEQGIAAEIVHVVIAGNSVEIPRGILNRQNLASKDLSRLSEPIKELDILLTQGCLWISCQGRMTQQTLPCLSSLSTDAFSLVHQLTTHLDLVQILIVLSLTILGQNIDDLEKYSEAKNKLEFMERTLRWRHLAPTAPNTLGCYPFTDRDPFLIESCPHVYFVGNQDKYETQTLEGSEGQLVRLICIPNFCETGTAVVLNLRNLECHTLTFGTSV